MAAKKSTAKKSEAFGGKKAEPFGSKDKDEKKPASKGKDK